MNNFKKINKIWNIPKSTGSYLVDQNGQRYLDFQTGNSLPLGWNNPRLYQKISDIDISWFVNKYSISNIQTEPMFEFINNFKVKVLPSDNSLYNPYHTNYPYLYLSDCYSLAVENALKITNDWKNQIIYSNNIQENLEILSFNGAFHGTSEYIMSITNKDNSVLNNPDKYTKWTKFDTPYRIQNQYQTKREDIVLSKIRQYFKCCSRIIAGIIIEPVQWMNGNRFLSQRFLTELQKLCNEFSVLFILDEVNTGFYTTGKQWLFQKLQLSPDIVIFSNKNQIAGFFGSERLNNFNHPQNVHFDSSFHGSLVDIIRCNAIIDIIHEDNLLDNVNKQSNYWYKEILNLNSNLIKNVHCCGSLMSFELPSQFHVNSLLKLLFEEYKHLVLSYDTQSIQFNTSLSVTSNDIQKSLDYLSNSLKIINKF